MSIEYMEQVTPDEMPDSWKNRALRAEQKLQAAEDRTKSLEASIIAACEHAGHGFNAHDLAIRLKAAEERKYVALDRLDKEQQKRKSVEAMLKDFAQRVRESIDDELYYRLQHETWCEHGDVDNPGGDEEQGDE